MFGLFSPKVSSGPLRSHLKKIWPPVQFHPGIPGLEWLELQRGGSIRTITEAAEKATQWLWIKRASLWIVAAGMRSGTWSTPVGSPGWGGLMLKDPKPPMTPGITDDASQPAPDWGKKVAGELLSDRPTQYTARCPLNSPGNPDGQSAPDPNAS